MGRDNKQIKVITVMEDMMGVGGGRAVVSLAGKIFRERKHEKPFIQGGERSAGRVPYHLYTDEGQRDVCTQLQYQDSKVSASE